VQRLTLLLVAALVIGAVVALRAPAATDWLDRFRDVPATAEPSGDGDGVRGLVVLPEDGRFAILDEITGAERSIDLYVYLLPADEVLSALADAHQRGVAVRVILEQDPFGGGNSNQDAFDRLSAAGIEVRWAPDGFQFSHIKTMVIDRRVAAIMTLNRQPRVRGGHDRASGRRRRGGSVRGGLVWRTLAAQRRYRDQPGQQPGGDENPDRRRDQVDRDLC
jgi:hypothetical protein